MHLIMTKDFVVLRVSLRNQMFAIQPKNKIPFN